MIAYVFVNPATLDVELLGRKPDRTEDAEAARPAHRRDDVSAVREGEDRNLDTQSFAQLGLHGLSSFLGTTTLETGRISPIVHPEFAQR
jgi:hypothetical protein